MRGDHSAAEGARAPSGSYARLRPGFAPFVRNASRTVRRLLLYLSAMHPAKLVVLGYGSYVVAGWLVLCMPFSQTHNAVSALDSLFIASSAVSTTGLVSVSVSDEYTVFGQAVVLLLIQLGGVGYMTVGSFVILARREELPAARRGVGALVFSMPASFRLDKFIRSVLTFTLTIEALGAAALYGLFQQAGVPVPLWSAVFHSVSAFCTAGFGLYKNSFESFAGNFWINAVIAALSYLGAVGFIVCVDVWRMLMGKTHRMTLTSKIILWFTFWLSVIGTLLLFLAEPSIQPLDTDVRLVAAFFQSMTAMTTVGFNTVPIAALSKASILLVITLMVIGASPSGTGGGIKSTTVSAMLALMWSTIKGRREVTFWGNAVPRDRVWTAVAGLGFYLAFLVIGAYFLALVEKASFDQCVFEAASALGTVGLSMGITAELSHLGKIIIIVLMYAGRVGPLTLAIALFAQSRSESDDQDHDLAV